MTGRVKVGVAIAVSLISVVSLGGAFWVNRPFQAVIGAYRTSLADRTEAQCHNIRQAVKALDGVIIEPGETFSFNETVGPRTSDRGYREASAYMERDLVTSIGGGICQVSSTVYNAAALSGLDIVERHPHSRLVSSVPPGWDATVWYGVADLKFTNTYPHPILISIIQYMDDLVVNVISRSNYGMKVYLYNTSHSMGNTEIVVYQRVRTIVYSDEKIIREVMSRDIYKE